MTVSPNSTLKKGTTHPLAWIPLKNGKENHWNVQSQYRTEVLQEGCR